MITVKVVSIDDNLQQLVDEINCATWDEGNEMATYDLASLSAYIEHPDTVFVVCREVSPNQTTLLGIASSRLVMKPYRNELWLHVDEVDVCADHRQKGAGKAIMRTLIEIAEEQCCQELWLATEVENGPANALYLSLEPDEVARIIGYTYQTAD